MGLIACKDCGEQIARTALRCPNCGGWQIVKPAKWAENAAGVYLLAFLIIAYFDTAWSDRITMVAIGLIPTLLVYGNAFARRRG